MNTKTHKNTETVWQGEPWDDELVSQLPRPSEKVRSAVFAAAETGLRQGGKKTVIPFSSSWRYGIGVVMAAAVLLIALAGLWHMTDSRKPATRAAQNDRAVEHMTDYVTETFETEELYPLLTADIALEPDDTLTAGIEDAQEQLALLEDDLAYDYFNL